MDGQTLRDLAIKVSQYFLDFLDSDFRKAQAPRRRIVQQTDAGFRAGMRVAPYPSLQNALAQIIAKPVSGGLDLRFPPRAYQRPISSNLKAIIRENIQAIPSKAVMTVCVDVLRQAQESIGRSVENPEAWIDGVRQALCIAIGAEIVRPLLALLDGPLSQQAYAVQDSIYSAESELTQALAAPADEILGEVLARYQAGGSASELAAALASRVTIDGVRASLQNYFESFVAADAFLEFRDVETYVRTGENLQLYLYLGTVKYGNNLYPLFYIPVTVESLPGSEGFVLTLVPHLYVNKRAVDFVLQEHGARAQQQRVSPIRERIYYIDPAQSVLDVAAPLFGQIATAMDLAGQVDLGGAPAQASNAWVHLSNAMHLSAFDRADEALLNDYEEMILQARTNAPGVISLFEGIVRGALIEEPASARAQVEAAWDALPLVDRVVVDSPIPINEEQQKICWAIDRSAARIINVEGPPGTGKSHTITAIAFQGILKGRSTLILSDKTEALDVVQDKLTQTMSRARHDDQFPNPILRLGRDHANFKRLTSNQTLMQVQAYVRANVANKPRVDAQLAATKSHLQDQIKKTVETLGGLPLKQISELHQAEAALEILAPGLAAELQDSKLPDHPDPLVPAATADVARHISLVHQSKPNCTAESLQARLRVDAAIVVLAAGADRDALSLFDSLDADQLRQLTSWIVAYHQLRMPLFGYLFRGARVRALEADINGRLLPNEPVLLRNHVARLERVVAQTQALRHGLQSGSLDESMLRQFYTAIVRGSVPGPEAGVALRLVTAVRQALGDSVPDPLNGKALPAHAGQIWIAAADYIVRWTRTAHTFRSVPSYDYVSVKSQIERLHTSTMNAEVDNRLVTFMDNHRAEARALSSVISHRQKFPEDRFQNVKQAFPVILASIREFGEYMPLLPDLFDVVIIDEGSQVSIAQAFPALLRAKKIVVFGDTKQFSNVKSANASIELNNRYRGDLEQFFRARVSTEASRLHRLSRFDVKCSVLEFCQLCANYSVMLRKHFRSYAELISFSSKTFYNGQLQALKIRGVPIEDVIRFDMVDPATGATGRNRNEPEAEFILARLLELLEEDEPPTVGIITPFREQQVLLTKKLFWHARGSDFERKLRLKIMTADSCQGEERQVIFYSLVATREHDQLNYIFPIDLATADQLVEEKLKMQRLNVAFSRAQEMIWFVTSKPIDEFRGSIARVMHHYQQQLSKPDLHAAATDPKSPMERKVLDWLQKTAFYQQNEERIEIICQFPIGDYLRQLDQTYQHPNWRTDFLLRYTTDDVVANILIEYDGFEFHWAPGREVNVGNHERYLLQADVERQLTLESYGYRFLRINRFNMGRDPVQTLSDRLTKMVAKLGQDDVTPAALGAANAQAAGLANKEMRQCTRCAVIKPLSDFFDQALKGGDGNHGRVCVVCKTKAQARPAHGARRRRRWSR